MLQKALGCLFVFGIAPVGIGGLWTKGIGQKREKILNLYLAGFLSELAVFQLIAVPVMVKEVYGMNLLVYLTTAVFAVLAATGFIWTLLRERDLRTSIKSWNFAARHRLKKQRNWHFLKNHTAMGKRTFSEKKGAPSSMPTLRRPFMLLMGTFPKMQKSILNCLS